MVEAEREPHLLPPALDFPGQGVLLGPLETAPSLDFLLNVHRTALRRSYLFSSRPFSNQIGSVSTAAKRDL